MSTTPGRLRASDRSIDLEENARLLRAALQPADRRGRASSENKIGAGGGGVGGTCEGGKQDASKNPPTVSGLITGGKNSRDNEVTIWRDKLL